MLEPPDNLDDYTQNDDDLGRIQPPNIRWVGFTFSD